MSQGATFEAEDSKYRFVSLFTRRKSLIITTRLRLLPFFLVVCFTATTALSTTFPFQSNNNNKNRNTNNNDNKKKNSNFHINTNGLPSKHPGQIISQILHQTNIHSDILTSTLITGSTHFTPPTEQGKKVDHDEDNEDDKTQTNDTDDESKKEEKIQMADDQKFKERIQSSIHTVQNWETVEWLQECRDIIPWDDLRNETGPYSRPEQDRLLADDSNALFLQRLCRWFPKFMTWVNAPPCSKCGSKDCEMKTVREPETEEEKEGNAKRVEGML